MTPNSRDIQAFNMVATELSFRRAAERLAMDQSALSRRIKQLEDGLGYLLIRRTTREVSLTAAGQIFHERTRLLGIQIDAAVQAARIAADGKRGHLTIAYMAFAAIEWMPRVVREFTIAYPEVDLELRYIHTQAQKLELARNTVDLGFMLGPLSHPQYEVLQLASERLVALLPIDHRLATRADVTLADLARYPLVLGSMAEWDFFRAFVLDVFAQGGQQVQVQYEASTSMGILGLVSEGLGVSVYAEAITRFQPRSILTKVIADCPARVQTLLVWNRAYKNPALMNFVRIARDLVKQPLA